MRDARISRIVEGTSEIMRLYIAREAMDTHVRQIMPLMVGKNKVGHFFGSFLPFYAAWLPKQFLPASTNFKVQHLDARNQAHLAFIAKSAKKLARLMFFTMAKYQTKLEREQMIMANFVDVGTDLFAMAATLSQVDATLGKASDKQALLDACDLFCTEARERVIANLKAVKQNHNHKYTKVANAIMDGKFDWMCTDIYGDTPPGYLKYMNKSLEAFEARQKESIVPQGSEASVN